MENRYIKPIEAGMLLPQLNTQDEYVRLMERVGFSIVSRKDISENCSKTWDICLENLLNPTLWKVAFSKGREVLSFVRTFQNMRAGYASGNFRYGYIVAQKPSAKTAKL